MARVLLTWELGGGSGHIVNLRPFGHGLESAGHKVLAALRDLRKGAKLFNSKARRRKRTVPDTFSRRYVYGYDTGALLGALQ